MHIPDGFIPLWQCVIYGIIMLVAWIFTIKWVIETLIRWDKEKPSAGKIITYLFLIVFILPLFVFTIHAFNVPVPFGTSVSLLGAVLVAIILRSPWGAVLIMSPVLIVQSLFFGDGGITTLGANLLNIGIIGGFTGFYIYKFAGALGKIPQALIGGFFAGLISVILVAETVAVEMGLAGTFPLRMGIIFMSIYSAIAGILEGIMTMIGCIILLLIANNKKSESNEHGIKAID